MSSVALARARMGWDAETVEMVRLRTEDDLDLVRRWLFPGQRIVVLSRDAGSPAAVARLLAETGHGAAGSPCWATWAVPTRGGTPSTEAVPGAQRGLCRGPGRGPYASLAAGLPDEAYEHDGQLTKRDLRASALANLMPRPGELLWDVGAGAGSIGIEWSRAHPRCRAIAMERDPDRAERIAANAARLGVPGLIGGAGHGAAGPGRPAPAGRRLRGRRARTHRCWTPAGPRCGRAAGWSSTR